MRFLIIYMNKTGDSSSLRKKSLLVLQRHYLVLQSEELKNQLGNGASNKENFVQSTVFILAKIGWRAVYGNV